MRPSASSLRVHERMVATRRSDTHIELRLRRLLHAAGCRYFVDRSPLPGVRSRADVVFPSIRLAIYVDSCFWHGCRLHGTWPKRNSEWWRAKLNDNARRDREVSRRLRRKGWLVFRVWEHDDMAASAKAIVAEVSLLRETTRRVSA
jgi:DNA mismatch endonuclease (patch repair protein)